MKVDMERYDMMVTFENSGVQSRKRSRILRLVESDREDDQSIGLVFCLLTHWISLSSLDLQLSHFQGDFHVVEYLGWETTYTEIVPSDR